MRLAYDRMRNYTYYERKFAVSRKKITAGEAYLAGTLRLPPGYHVELDADLLALLREDGSTVAAFTAEAPPAEVAKAAEEDYRASGNNSA